MTDLYNIVMKGKSISGRDNQEVQQSLAKIFKEPPEKMGRLLSGKQVIVKKSIDHEQAVKIIRIIEKAGAECKIVKQKTTLSKPLSMEKNDTAESKLEQGSDNSSKSQQSSETNPYRTPSANLVKKQQNSTGQENQRPTSITVVSWILIVTGGLTLITSTFSLMSPITQDIMSKSPIPISIQYIMLYVGLLITLGCGIAMLKRQNWARLLYVGWSIFGFIIGIATSPMKIMIIPGILIFLIYAFFLFRPKANEYFKGIVSS